MASNRNKSVLRNLDTIRKAAEGDLEYFAKLVNPMRLYGELHSEMFDFWTKEIKKSAQLCLIPRGHQKALRLDQKILTPTGFKELKEIEVGDVIYGSDGQEQKVVQLHPISEMNLFKLTFSDGRTSICNSEHLWNFKVYGVEDTYSVADIQAESTYVKKERYYLNPCKPIQHTEIPDLPIDPYTLGVWLGSGYKYTGIIQINDARILDYLEGIANRLPSLGNKYKIEGFVKQLKGIKALNNKIIPEEYFLGSRSQRLSLLSGIIDSSGFLLPNTALAGQYITGNLRIKEYIERLVRSLGGKCNSYVEDSSYTLDMYMPEGCPLTSLPVSSVKMEDDLLVYLVKISKEKNALGRCITVSNDDGLFITNDYLVTHNSHLAAVKMAWFIINNPCITILYISATAQLAEAQLFAIKNILSSEIVQLLWPELTNIEESKRERWTVSEIIVDHPSRKLEGVRDFTVTARGLTANITGLHADHICLDDVVVPSNAYTSDGREKVANMYSQLASIKNPGAGTTVVGTRYHAKDLYDTLLGLEYIVYDEETDEYLGRDKVYEVMERVVEEQGVFLWPKQMRQDGKFFGFDRNTLSQIKAEYIDSSQFYSQYYNDPNDPDNARISRSKFQYYERRHLSSEYGIWSFKKKRLNVYAAIDFAFSLNSKADYTAIVVVGIDRDKNLYVLDINRFKTDRIPVYFKNIVAMYNKWGFRKLRAETNAAQVAIVRELKEGYFKPQGIMLSVDEYRPSKVEGSKEERVNTILEPRYDNLLIWHYKGGNCTLLEEELVLNKPSHDDIKDALSAVIDIAVAPKRNSTRDKDKKNVIYSKRFGGIAYRNDR